MPRRRLSLELQDQHVGIVQQHIDVLGSPHRVGRREHDGGACGAPSRTVGAVGDFTISLAERRNDVLQVLQGFVGVEVSVLDPA